MTYRCSSCGSEILLDFRLNWLGEYAGYGAKFARCYVCGNLICGDDVEIVEGDVWVS